MTEVWAVLQKPAKVKFVPADWTLTRSEHLLATEVTGLDGHEHFLFTAVVLPVIAVGSLLNILFDWLRCRMDGFATVRHVLRSPLGGYFGVSGTTT